MLKIRCNFLRNSSSFRNAARGLLWEAAAAGVCSVGMIYLGGAVEGEEKFRGGWAYRRGDRFRTKVHILEQ